MSPFSFYRAWDWNCQSAIIAEIYELSYSGYFKKEESTPMSATLGDMSPQLTCIKEHTVRRVLNS